MNLFSAMEIAASGLLAQRARINALASNLANARTTRTPEGGPYRRLDPVFRAVPLSERFSNLVERAGEGGAGREAYLVEVPEVRRDAAPPRRVYDPDHPDAGPDGFVEMPNVEVVTEMVNLVTASRAYEAGVSVVKTVEAMARSALSIGA